MKSGTIDNFFIFLFLHKNQCLNFFVFYYADEEPAGASDKLKESYKFLGMWTVKSLPYWGKISTYNGGGYVADLGLSAYSVST